MVPAETKSVTLGPSLARPANDQAGTVAAEGKELDRTEAGHVADHEPIHNAPLGA